MTVLDRISTVLIAASLAAAAACGGDEASPSPDSLHLDVATTPDAAETTTAGSDAATDDVSVPPPPGRVVINEVECRADPVEWVELFNAGGTPVDLAGYRVADAADDAGVRVPATVIAPGAFVLVQGDIGLACDRDAAYLIGGGRVVDVAPVRRGDPELAAWGRIPDGDGDFVEVAPTPHKANRSLEDERASIFAVDGPMPVIDLFVASDAEAILMGERAWAPAVFTWTDARGSSAPQRVDIRIKGAITSRPWYLKPSLKLHFARHDAPGPKAFRGAKKLALHNMAYDPSTVREWLAYEVMRRVGLPAPRVSWASVRVNGVAKGLYGLIESYDEIFLRDHYDETVALYEADGDLSPGLGGIFLDEGESMAPIERLVDRIAVVIGNRSVPTQALPEINWNNLALLFGAEDVLQHTDGMKSGCHNYYLHLDAADDWTFMAWSVDLTLIFQFGNPGPIGSCSQLALLCDRDPRCVTWFLRARDQVAQLVLREDLRGPALALATRNQPHADRSQEPWTGNEFWPDVEFDLAASAAAAVDLLELRARLVRCATAAERGTPDPGDAEDPDDPTCGGFVRGPNPGSDGPPGGDPHE